MTHCLATAYWLLAFACRTAERAACIQVCNSESFEVYPVSASCSAYRSLVTASSAVTALARGSAPEVTKKRTSPSLAFAAVIRVPMPRSLVWWTFLA